jgi:hypothetical protein
MAVANAAPPSPVLIGHSGLSTASGAINTGETILTKAGPLSANRLTLGTHIRVTWIGTCTSTAGNVSTFNIYIGALGTTSDPKAFSAALAVAQTSGTNVVFRAEGNLTITAVGAGTSATCVGTLILLNNGTTGISTTVTQTITATVAGFDTTIEGNIISVSYLSAASTTTSTFQQCFIETILR